MLENFEEKPVSDINNAMHAFFGTLRALPVFARGLAGAVLKAGRPPDPVTKGDMP
jgi:hypothetical protein